MTELTVASRIAEILLEEGVTTICGYPTTPLLESAAMAGIRPIIPRQERVGVNIADGLARTTGGDPFGVFCMQYGPGAENAYSGIATAFADSVPLLVLPLGYPADRENLDRYFSSLRNYAGVCKSLQRIRSADEVDPVMRRAIAGLRSGRPGPVLVEVPIDLAAAPVTGTPWARVTGARPSPDVTAIDRALPLLVEARRPVIVAGQGVLYAGATDALVRFAEGRQLPVSTTLAGKGAFPESHPLSLGCGGMTKPLAVHDYLRDADVVLALGASMTRHAMTATVPSGKILIHVSVDASDFDRDYPAAVAIQADALLAVEALTDGWAAMDGGCRSPERSDPAREIRATHERWRAGWKPRLTSAAVPIDPYRVVHEICIGFPAATSMVTHDSGSPRDQLVPFYPADEPHSYLGWGKSHALGTGLGLAIGAKLAAPAKYAVALMGDAAFGMVGLDLETAVRHGAPVIAIVNNNGTMAIETEHMRRSHERFRTRDIGGDYCSLARSLGAEARMVEDPAALAAAFEWAKSCNDDGCTVLIDIRTSPVMTEFSLRGV